MSARTRRLSAARTGAEDRLAALRIRQLMIANRLAENEQSPADDDRVATALAEIRDRYAHGAKNTTTGRDVCASADDVPRLIPRKGTTTMSKTRTITLTGRRPVTINEDEWPVIAKASGDNYQGLDPARHVQASTQGELDEYSLRVRQHADGRAIVYGTYTEGWHSSHDGLTRAGELVDAGGSIEYVIMSVGETLRVSKQLVADCIADLPADPL